MLQQFYDRPQPTSSHVIIWRTSQSQRQGPRSSVSSASPLMTDHLENMHGSWSFDHAIQIVHMMFAPVLVKCFWVIKLSFIWFDGLLLIFWEFSEWFDPCNKSAQVCNLLLVWLFCKLQLLATSRPLAVDRCYYCPVVCDNSNLVATEVGSILKRHSQRKI